MSDIEYMNTNTRASVSAYVGILIIRGDFVDRHIPGRSSVAKFAASMTAYFTACLTAYLAACLTAHFGATTLAKFVALIVVIRRGRRRRGGRGEGGCFLLLLLLLLNAVVRRGRGRGGGGRGQRSGGCSFLRWTTLDLTFGYAEQEFHLRHIFDEVLVGVSGGKRGPGNVNHPVEASLG